MPKSGILEMTLMSLPLNEKNDENEGIRGVKWIQAKNESISKLNILSNELKNDAFWGSKRKLNLYENDDYVPTQEWNCKTKGF